MSAAARVSRWLAFLLHRSQPGIGVYNGVPARDVPWHREHDHEPEYKSAYIDAITERVTPGDTVVIVGGERSIDAVHAARAGAETVIVYEAAREAYQTTRETIALNDLTDTVDARYAAVGEVLDAYGEDVAAESVAPDELPACDLLVLDCEGAERSILEGLDAAYPVVVETHPRQGTPTNWVVEQTDGQVVGVDDVDGHIVAGTTGGSPDS